MTDSDHDLKRMFQAQRLVDEMLAPAFEEVAVATSSNVIASPASSSRKPMLVVAVMAAAAACLVIGIVRWSDKPDADAPGTTADASVELRELRLICDSLIETIDNTSVAVDSSSTFEEMEWPSGTASLLPSESLAFNLERNAP